MVDDSLPLTVFTPDNKLMCILRQQNLLAISLYGQNCPTLTCTAWGSVFHILRNSVPCSGKSYSHGIHDFDSGVLP